MRTLLTGAQGFIGRNVWLKLGGKLPEVEPWDSLEPQVHGTGERHSRAGEGNWGHSANWETVIHLAALVGVGQSMYEPARYVECNTLDTARFLENLTKNKPNRLVVASSMSIYGEGDCIKEDGKRPRCRKRVPSNYVGWYPDFWDPVATDEETPPEISSVYALTKFDQEQLCLMWGEANGVDVIALRFFNVFGPGQALQNPYTGALAIFATRLLNGKAPMIYEDGLQTRDFIYVDDVARAVVHAATNELAPGIYNVGTGNPRTIRSVAADLAIALGVNIAPEITHKYRVGDIRHCFANVGKINATGWKAETLFHDGLKLYVEWLKQQPKPEDRFDTAAAELENRNLVH